MKLGRVLRTLGIGAFFGVVAATQSGCLVAAAAGAGAATVAYVNGQATANMDAPVEKVAAATKSVFEDDMKAIVFQYQPNAPEAKIYARTTTDHRIEVLVKSLTDKASKVSVRVDNFGDEGTSRDVLNRIEQKLKG
ncbi:MAG: DUF3568 family protein [Tepidisphaerales bacterium]